MNARRTTLYASTLLGLALTLLTAHGLMAQAAESADPADDIDTESKEAAVYCANLVYATDKTSVCFSDEFLTQVREETNILTHPTFDEVHLDSAELFDYPFAVMTGEGGKVPAAALIGEPVASLISTPV